MLSSQKCSTGAQCNECGTTMIEYLFYAGLMIMLCIAGVGIIGKRSQDMLQHDVLVEALNDSK